MNRWSLLLLVSLLHLPTASAQEVHGGATSADHSVQVAGFHGELGSNNSIYMDMYRIEFFAGLSRGQSPVATVVTCSDSRVHTVN